MAGLGHREGRAIQDRLHPLYEPIALGLVGDAGEFDAEGSAVGCAEFFDQFAQCPTGPTGEAAAGYGAVEVSGGDSKICQFEQWMMRAIVAERVEVGDEMAEFAVGMDE